MSRMQVSVLRVSGLKEALLGLSLNKNQKVEHMQSVAYKLAPLDGGHNKFLEMIVVWLDITAPRYWWSQFDTYRVGITKQSQSTMHTGTQRELTQDDFIVDIPSDFLDKLNECVREGDLLRLKQFLPEGFLQRRIVMTNYKTLRNIYQQRKNHKLKEWSEIFCPALRVLPNHHVLFI